MRGIDIVDHQIEGRAGAGRGRLLDLPHDDMRAAAQFQDGQLVARHDRAQPDRLQPARRGADIADIEAHMADRDRRPLIAGLGFRLALGHGSLRQ